MNESEVIFLAAAGCIILYALVRAYRFRALRCPECGGRLALKSVKDPMGISISKKVSFSIYQGPRKYKEIWSCEECNHQVEKQYWGS